MEGDLEFECFCYCAMPFDPEYGEFKRCPKCFAQQIAEAEKATGVE